MEAQECSFKSHVISSAPCSFCPSGAVTLIPARLAGSSAFINASSPAWNDIQMNLFWCATKWKRNTVTHSWETMIPRTIFEFRLKNAYSCPVGVRSRHCQFSVCTEFLSGRENVSQKELSAPIAYALTKWTFKLCCEGRRKLMNRALLNNFDPSHQV